MAALSILRQSPQRGEGRFIAAQGAQRFFYVLARAGVLLFAAGLILVMIDLLPPLFENDTQIGGISTSPTRTPVEGDESESEPEASATSRPPTETDVPSTRTPPPALPTSDQNATPTAITAYTFTPSPTPEDGDWQPCPNTYDSRLHVGDRAYVAFDPPLANRVRSSAGSNGKIEGLIQPGDEINIVEGPTCANNWIWWKINAKNGSLSGWTSEGDMEDYWLVPLP